MAKLSASHGRNVNPGRIRLFTEARRPMREVTFGNYSTVKLSA